jgi:hypothetical protein
MWTSPEDRILTSIFFGLELFEAPLGFVAGGDDGLDD